MAQVELTSIAIPWPIVWYL